MYHFILLFPKKKKWARNEKEKTTSCSSATYNNFYKFTILQKKRGKEKNKHITQKEKNSRRNKWKKNFIHIVQALQNT